MEKLIYEDLIHENREAFIRAVKNLAERLGVKPNWLMLVFYIETAASVTGRINHAIQNEKSKATGLIQFMPETAKSLGVTVELLQKMSNLDQLYYVEKYFRPYRLKMKSPTDVYLAVFFPAAIGKGDEYVFQTSRLPAEKIATWNPLYDTNKDKRIQKWEVKQKVLSFIPKGVVI